MTDAELSEAFKLGGVLARVEERILGVEEGDLERRAVTRVEQHDVPHELGHHVPGRGTRPDVMSRFSNVATRASIQPPRRA